MPRSAPLLPPPFACAPPPPAPTHARAPHAHRPPQPLGLVNWRLLASMRASAPCYPAGPCSGGGGGGGSAAAAGGRGPQRVLVPHPSTIPYILMKALFPVATKQL